MANNGQAPFVTCVTVKPDTVARRSANYHPSIWGDHFLAYSSYNNLTKTDAEEEKHDEQLEQVKKLIVTSADEPRKQLKLIDDIQRLGVAYHFETEIEAALQSMNIDTIHEHDDDLHNVALCFRLLRQQGHNVPSDVFYKFKDSNGKLKEQLKKDARGVLSLYEATHVRVHGEEILDEAAAFTTSQLELLKSDLGNPYAVQAIGAIKCPARRCLNRLEARRYISIYQQDESHNELLLNFAKLDFNFLQKEHQQELAHLTRWWKELNCAENFPFARDRMVECYFWILGVYFEPQYLMARRFLTKIIALTSIADDLYDVYGTLEELVILTDAIERWDMKSLDQLPGCMRIFYRALLEVYNEMEEELVNTGKSSEFNRVHYAKASYTELLRAYLAEAKWFQENHVPTLEEYMSVALLSGAYKMLSTHSYVGMGEIATREAFDWLSNNPLIIKATSIICRLSDDMVGHEFEQKRGHVASAVDCYMKEHGVTKADAYKEFKEGIVNAWKDMNQECVRPTAVAMPLLERIYNLACVINLLYVDGEDCYTHSNTRTKDFITSVLVDPVPV